VAEKSRGPTEARHAMYWVMHQHDDVTVIESRERPSSDPVEGERRIHVRGPFKTREDAERAADKIHARTFAHLRGERR